MTNEDESGDTQAAEPRDARQSVAQASTERRLPFTLRVATSWTTEGEFADEEDGQLLYLRRSVLTGNLVATTGGRDLGFSDLEVLQP